LEHLGKRLESRIVCEIQEIVPLFGGNAMNWDQVQGNWKQLKGRVQQQWGKLTDDDVDVIDGKRKELVGKVQERYGYAREKAEAEVEEFCTQCK
jgi:uncharacterized protein YjbJ (UPF0337 family)